MARYIKFIIISFFVFLGRLSYGQDASNEPLYFLDAWYGMNEEYTAGLNRAKDDRTVGISFVVRGALGSPDNQSNEILIELSDPHGSFANENEVKLLAKIKTPGNTTGTTVNGAASVLVYNYTGVKQEVTLKLPEVECSKDYKIRLKNSKSGLTRLVGKGPKANSAEESKTVEITESNFIYMILPTLHSDKVQVNENKPAIMCNGYVDLPITGPFATESKYSNMGFVWGYRAEGESEFTILEEHGKVLRATKPGYYHAKPYYGICDTGASDRQLYSILIRVFDSSSFHVKLSGSNEPLKELMICEGGGGSTTLSIESVVQDANLEFVWKRNGAEISRGMNDYILEINTTSPDASGNYELNINSPSCPLKATFKVGVLNKPTGVSLKQGSDIMYIANAMPIVELAGMPTVGSDVEMSYRWVKEPTTLEDPEQIPGTNKFKIKGAGKYKAVVVLHSKSGNCDVESDQTNEVTYYSVGSATLTLGSGDLVSCDKDSETLKVDKIELVAAEDANKKQTISGSGLDNFKFSWMANGAVVEDVNTPSIEIGKTHAPGKYKASVEIQGVTVAPTNEVTIAIRDNISLKITETANPYICSGQAFEFEAKYKGVAVADGLVKWYKMVNGNEEEIAGETKSKYKASEVGVYFAKIPANTGGLYSCDLISKKIEVSENPFKVQFKGEVLGASGELETMVIHPFLGEKTLEAELPVAPTNITSVEIQWFKNGVEVAGKSGPYEANNTLTITEGGEYVAKVKDAGGCNTWAETKKQVVKMATSYKGVVSSCRNQLRVESIEAKFNDGTKANLGEQEINDYFKFVWKEKDSAGTITEIAGEEARTYTFDDKGGERKFVVGLKVAQTTTAVFEDSDEVVVLNPEIKIDNVLVSEKKLKNFTGNGVVLKKEATSVVMSVEGGDETKYQYKWVNDKGVEQTGLTTTYNGSNDELLGMYVLTVHPITATDTGCDISKEVILLKEKPQSVSVGGVGLTDTDDVSKNWIYTGVEVIEGIGKNVEVVANFDIMEVKDPEGNVINNVDDKTFTVLKKGEYSVVLKRDNGSGGEEITHFVVKVEGKSVMDIPNVVAVRSEVGNQYWVLPDDYMSKEDCVITIYDGRGNKVFESNNYGTNGNFWPKELKIDAEKKGMSEVYFYMIDNKGKGEKLHGTITLLN